MSKLVFNSNTDYARNLAEQSASDTNFGQATKEAIQGRVIEQRKLGENLMGSGLSASGYHDRTEGEQVQNYSNARATAQLTKNQEDQARLAIREALRSGFDIDAAAALGEAVGRRGEREENNADKAPGEPTPAAAAANGKGSGPGAKAGKGKNQYGVASNKALGKKPIPRPAVVHNKPINPYKAALGNRKASKK
jgi:hypothetical protein